MRSENRKIATTADGDDARFTVIETHDDVNEALLLNAPDEDAAARIAHELYNNDGRNRFCREKKWHVFDRETGDCYTIETIDGGGPAPVC